MRYAFALFAVVLAMHALAGEPQARSRFDVSIGFGVSSGRWGGHDYSRASFRYSDCAPSYRPRVIVASPRVYCPPPVIIQEPVYCPPPRVIYQAPVIVERSIGCEPDMIVSDRRYESSHRPTYYHSRASYRYGR